MKLLILLAFAATFSFGLAQLPTNQVNATQWEQLQWSKFKVQDKKNKDQRQNLHFFTLYPFKKALYQKKYRTTDREQKRFSAFLANLRDIRSHNANAVNDDDVDYYLKINKFADWVLFDKFYFKLSCFG